MGINISINHRIPRKAIMKAYHASSINAYNEGESKEGQRKGSLEL